MTIFDLENIGPVQMAKKKRTDIDIMISTTHDILSESIIDTVIGVIGDLNLRTWIEILNCCVRNVTRGKL
jgi:hypothetical protein